ncbi:tRNA (adenosine(37)-N6)-threonylcarbamoyltransferase complex dimerization subunit type 1 TsaB [Aquibacillus sp. 3ASR75-11]|uniref:tRNA (Adenosine(37)-N6)-threonylcarbamoyltransferase complex dimerization subunit type 1 TsaB n=1 Tax=Terrihalobacillus insolitus TaxID=2950438 RepID=A0A9X3WXX8_9BACI|nr:tRNA (adenosine(37)-N6)-threonylcarbamoyltransferase complex dimerization subunit type 1 TsaB [Terrihalobacillus insolitus]MDC3414233.1 tRNA (adenosine(37)-N6)-threonylcarbamoyltransferase complex dimerization subunit type 1 TsaB [Terrihalobacillus insolitus]MDC3426216.1 tRNA (adenosine(37)-N6)-threonylcarbamoyltransferase complex dimerization subunit type 1 TsaB [Terrihalobacillus insolitus]
MNILAIDTSNQVMGVAITKDGVLVGELITNVKRNHSVRLMPAIDQLMKETDTRPVDINKIVVANGPGSFTGVRIGLATAKTMGWALQIPVVGISSLQVLADQGAFSTDYICPFFDARRGLVYTGLYKGDGNGKIVESKKETNVLFAEWLKSLAEQGEKVVFLSQDMEMHRQNIMKYMGSLATIPKGSIHTPRPSTLAMIGENRTEGSIHTLVPNYLRLAEAEANWLKQQETR